MQLITFPIRAAIAVWASLTVVAAAVVVVVAWPVLMVLGRGRPVTRGGGEG
jgi:hypothetical protein